MLADKIQFGYAYSYIYEKVLEEFRKDKVGVKALLQNWWSQGS